MSDLSSSKAARRPAAPGAPESNVVPVARSPAARRRPDDEADDAAGEATAEAAQTTDAIPSESGGDAGPNHAALMGVGVLAAVGLAAAAGGGAGAGDHVTPSDQVHPEASKPGAPMPETPKPGAPRPEAPNPEASKPDMPASEAPKPETPAPDNPSPETPRPPVDPFNPVDPVDPVDPPKPAVPETPVEPGKPATPPVVEPPVEPTPTPTPIDPTPPTAVTLALKHDTGADATDRHTSDATVTLTGLEPDASWRYSTDGGKTWHAGSGQEFVPLVADGPCSVQVIQRDQAGNDSLPASLAFTLDTGAPTLALKNDTCRMRWDDQQGIRVPEVEAHAHDGITKDGTLVVNGLEAGAPWSYSLDHGQHWIAGSGNEIAAAALGADGLKTIQVKRTDARGGGFSEFSFTLDTTAKVLQLQLKQDDGQSPDDFVTSDATMRVIGREEGAAVVSERYVADWTAQGTVSEVDVSRGDGLLVVRATQIDLAGNESSGGRWLAVFKDSANTVTGPQLKEADVLHGTAGADTFAWPKARFHTWVLDYDARQGDVLDLAALLSVAEGASIDRYVQVGRDGTQPYLVLDETGRGNFTFPSTSITLGNMDADAPIVLHTANGGVFTV
ncbi:Ig-like domain-containing protein [Mitsuaria sp. GD03876]|uniref:Ig-like domain-containing protein n=1 Tax=Mitsuaria sp. GD03876 TaxID=2975399 RepID=UPI00244A989D|nr:Ig-like domain-containing protein [Mitsuaria sp. GD03876]